MTLGGGGSQEGKGGGSVDGQTGAELEPGHPVQGEAVQAEPMQSKLKAPRTM